MTWHDARAGTYRRRVQEHSTDSSSASQPLGKPPAALRITTTPVTPRSKKPGGVKLVVERSVPSRPLCNRTGRLGVRAPEAAAIRCSRYHLESRCRTCLGSPGVGFLGSFVGLTKGSGWCPIGHTETSISPEKNRWSHSGSFKGSRRAPTGLLHGCGKTWPRPQRDPWQFGLIEVFAGAIRGLPEVWSKTMKRPHCAQQEARRNTGPIEVFSGIAKGLTRVCCKTTCRPTRAP